jgi:hypothetical protein
VGRTRKEFLVWIRTHGEFGNLPHFVESEPKFSNWRKESACCRAIQFQDGIEIGDADINPEARSANGFIQTDLPQFSLKLPQDKSG